MLPSSSSATLPGIKGIEQNLDKIGEENTNDKDNKEIDQNDLKQDNQDSEKNVEDKGEDDEDMESDSESEDDETQSTPTVLNGDWDDER